MPSRKPSVYLFNWPSGLGGADTKAEHLLRLLKDDFDWTVVPNAADRMSGAEGRKGGVNKRLSHYSKQARVRQFQPNSAMPAMPAMPRTNSKSAEPLADIFVSYSYADLQTAKIFAKWIG